MKQHLFFIILFIIACPSIYSQKCSFRLTGHVHSTVTHENLAGAVVSLGGRTIITDHKGDFRFDSLCYGNHHIIITHTSFDSVSTTISLTKNTHLDFDLLPLENVLSEVTITGVRNAPQTGIRKELMGRELEETRGGSLAEALSKLNGVTMLQTGATISKPVIHGLHSNRILTINNGVRQEGQQWGNEHAPEIDPFIANRLTVIKGVDELRYGSDAIGGVILVEPRPLRQTQGYSAEFNTLYFTNNRKYVASAIFEQQLRRLPSVTYRVQGTYLKGANISTPEYRLNNTGHQEKNFSLTSAYKKEHFSTELYYSLFNTQIGIFTGSHIGNLADLERAIASSRPDPTFTGQNIYHIDRPNQDIQHHLIKSKTSFDLGNSRFNILLAGQYNNRKEYDVVRNAATRGAQINLSISSFTEEITWEYPKKGNLNGVAGLVAMQQDNSYSGRYLIPNYQLYNYGGYYIEKWAKNKWDAQAGIRFDYKNINTQRVRAGTQTLSAYSFNFSTVASSVNVGYKILPELKTNATLSISTRAPHVNELLIDGVHHGTGTYERGNLNLKPEQSFNVSIANSYTSNNKVLQLDLTLYRNKVQNYIFQQPRPDEPVLTIRGAFPLIEYIATDARLQGLDFSSTLRPAKPLAYIVRYSHLRGRNLRTSDWLISLPSDRLSNGLLYSFKDGKRLSDSYLSFDVLHVMEQKRIPNERFGKHDYKAPPAAYTLLNADVSTTIDIGKLPLTFGVSGRNLLNNVYREYLNTFRYYTDERGRNISIRIKLNLKHFY